MPKKPEKKGNDIPQWVVTYGDLMSLLLCFFILLAAFSELKDPDEFRKVIEIIREALGYEGGLGHAQVPDSPTNTMVNLLEEARKRADNQMFVSEQNQTNTVGQQPKVSIVHDGNYQTVGKTVFFEPGATELSPFQQEQLRSEVAPLIRDRNNIVRIVGHASGYQDMTTGNLHDTAYQRALSALDFLVNECGIDARILRIESAGNVEPLADSGEGTERGGSDRRVQIYMTDRLIDQVNRDVFGTGRGR